MTQNAQMKRSNKLYNIHSTNREEREKGTRNPFLHNDLSTGTLKGWILWWMKEYSHPNNEAWTTDADEVNY